MALRMVMKLCRGVSRGIARRTDGEERGDTPVLQAQLKALQLEREMLERRAAERRRRRGVTESKSGDKAESTAPNQRGGTKSNKTAPKKPHGGLTSAEDLTVTHLRLYIGLD